MKWLKSHQAHGNFPLFLQKYFSYLFSEVSEGELRQAFMSADPGLPVSVLDQYVSRAFGDNAPTADDTLERATVIRRLHTGSIRRYENNVKK